MHLADLGSYLQYIYSISFIMAWNRKELYICCTEYRKSIKKHKHGIDSFASKLIKSGLSDMSWLLKIQ